jgi:hypothetical protein
MRNMGYPDYKRDLMAPEFNVNRVLNRYFHSGQSVVFYGAAPETEPAFKSELASHLLDALRIQLHPLQLVVCGSAHLGFSPVPDKLGKPFDPSKSDIDVAVVSGELFDLWWAELQEGDPVQAVYRRIAEDLFWGFINPVNVNTVTRIGGKWWDVFGKMQTDRAQAVRGRLYRNYWSMQNYHRHAIEKGRKKLQGART